MNKFYNAFKSLLDSEDKQACVEFAFSKLNSGEIDIPTLYIDILTKALNNLECKEPEAVCIWREHVKTSIVRTIIESCYLHIVEIRDKEFGKKKGPKVIVICPPMELHEIGPRMAADFFLLSGFEVTFVGANTPEESILSSIKIVKPDYVAISITNPYNLVESKKIIKQIRKRGKGKIKIIVGGNAFTKSPRKVKELRADIYIQNLDEIRKLREAKR